MKLKLSLIFASLFVIFAFSAVARAQDGPIAGGYGDTDVTDKGVVAAAKFAVKKHYRNTKWNATLDAIKNAKVQVVAGLNYQLCLQISTRNRSKKPVVQFVRAIVYRNLKNGFSLTSWTPLEDEKGC
ncbi:MAG: hypothetical protein JSS81_15945 [Acidobacteria bacterium]|nr:hypothetical protein [Acidobacteriota bacterium]